MLKKRRKAKDLELPPWKQKVHDFNETCLGRFEKFVEHIIPWLVISLLFIIIAEFGEDLFHIFGEHPFLSFLPVMHEIAEHYHTIVVWLDGIIIGFFVIDLYFAFFKKATIWNFLKTSCIDILAIAPVGLIFNQFKFIRFVKEAQEITHLGAEGEKIITKTAKSTKLLRAITRAPRLLRLYRLSDMFSSDNHRKKPENKKKASKKNK